MNRILQIVDYIYPCISGIGETAMDIAETLKSRDVQQKIICINHNVVKDGKETQRKRNVREKVNGIEVIRCKMDLHISSQPISFSYIRIIDKIMKDFNPEIVIFHYPNPFLAHFLLRYKSKPFKLIVWWHSDIIKQKVLGKLFVKQNLDLMKRSSKLVATSQNYIDGSKYLSKYKEKCIVVPSCFREDELEITDKICERAKEIKPENKIMCFSLGRHVTYKGFEYLIKAAQYLDDRFAFYIGSNGPLTETLKEMAAGDDRFHFTGHLSEEDLKAYYYACDIFCFPSITKNEAFGLALVDAMYYGKPAVTFTIPGSGVNYVCLDKVTGVECENRNVKQYAGAIKQLANDDDFRINMGKNAHRRAVEKFSYKVFQQNVLNLFDSVRDKSGI